MGETSCFCWWVRLDWSCYFLFFAVKSVCAGWVISPIHPFKFGSRNPTAFSQNQRKYLYHPENMQTSQQPEPLATIHKEIKANLAPRPPAMHAVP
ncbi:hypothetical protein VTJ04DRAFT_2463 [Mycothermus thermophilus]|uniref:uncharacterized protein n=1 Tax=Humicola insolens TaxID=85995 RepID=UPI0037436AD3